MSKLSDIVIQPDKPSKGPLWKGPEVDGITFSLLSRFLVCRERFRLYAIEGIRPVDRFNHKTEYGTMWHLCEENYKSSNKYIIKLAEYVQQLCIKYPMQQDEIDKWYNVCKTQFPLYIEFWNKHPDTKEKVSLLKEQVFDIPYRLPSNRIVRLRGRWDEVFLMSESKRTGVYIKENKTKGDIEEDKLIQQLGFDFQTGIYLTALGQYNWMVECNFFRVTDKPVPVKGVLYNVVRRPLSGGKGTIVRHKPTKSNPSGESKREYYNRLGNIIREDPEHYFMRWNVNLLPDDVNRFKKECLDPILEQLCDWWQWIQTDLGKENPFNLAGGRGLHWRTPFGIYNPLLEGGQTDLDEYLRTGSMTGLTRTDKLFGELEGDSK